MKAIITIAVCTILLTLTVSSSALFDLPETLQGTVEQVNKDALTVVSQEGSNQQVTEIQINEETEFEKIASYHNLREGDKVEVKYREEGEQKIAVSVLKISEKNEETSSGYRS